MQPRWRRAGDDFVAIWDYCLPYRFWCLIRARFGAWTICGTLRTCAEPHAPIAGATVRAFDADWLQDDALGDAVTDATGRFRIDYLASDFTLTPFSPLINVEFAGGPDVYFTAQLGSVTILSETAGHRAASRAVKTSATVFAWNCVQAKSCRPTWKACRTGSRWRYSISTRFRRRAAFRRRAMRAGRHCPVCLAAASP